MGKEKIRTVFKYELSLDNPALQTDRDINGVRHSNVNTQQRVSTL